MSYLLIADQLLILLTLLPLDVKMHKSEKLLEINEVSVIACEDEVV